MIIISHVLQACVGNEKVEESAGARAAMLHYDCDANWITNVRNKKIVTLL